MIEGSLDFILNVYLVRGGKRLLRCRVALLAHHHRWVVRWVRNVVVHLRLRWDDHGRTALISIVRIFVGCVVVVVVGVLRDEVRHLRHVHGVVVGLRWEHVLHREMRHWWLRSRGKHWHLWHWHITIGW